MRLLLTRAADDAARTRAKLEANGHSVLVSPVIEIVALDAVWPRGIVDALIVTSGHAFASLRHAFSPSPEARRLMPLLLVGSRTEESARQHGFLGAALVMPNATLLAVEIGDLVPRPRRIVYLAGRDRKPDVERALRLTGQPIEIVETYEARPVHAFEPAIVTALRNGRVDGVLHFSRRSAALFLDQTKKAGLDTRPASHFCLSDDVASPLREAGCAVKIAEAPNEAALLSSLDGS